MDEQSSRLDLEQVRRVNEHLEGINKALEQASDAARELLDEWNDAPPSAVDDPEAVVLELIEPILGRLGACADLVALSLGGVEAFFDEQSEAGSA